MPFVPDGGGLLVKGPDKPDRSYGILTAIEPIHISDPHWQTGIEVESDCSVEAFSTLPPCPDPTGSMSTDDGLTFCSAEPFTVYGSYKCSPVGRPESEAKTIASNRLKRNKERTVEQIFWTGITTVGPVNPSLQGGNSSCGIVPVDLTPVGGPLSPVAAIAALESNIADCTSGSTGIIHVNYGLLPYLASHNLLVERSGKFYTPSGQIIVAGAGYPTSGPNNVPAVAGETWVFATGPMSVYYSDVFFTAPRNSQAINRSVNDITVHAEQTFSVIFECCLFCLRIALC